MSNALAAQILIKQSIAEHLSIHSNNDYVAIAFELYVVILNIPTLDIDDIIHFDKKITCIALSESTKELAVATLSSNNASNIRVYRKNDCNDNASKGLWILCNEITIDTPKVSNFQFCYSSNPDQSELFCCAGIETFILRAGPKMHMKWNLKTFSEHSLAKISPNGQYIATYSVESRFIKIWRRESFAESVPDFEYIFHSNTVFDVDWRIPSKWQIRNSSHHPRSLLYVRLQSPLGQTLLYDIDRLMNRKDPSVFGNENSAYCATEFARSCLLYSSDPTHDKSKIVCNLIYSSDQLRDVLHQRADKCTDLSPEGIFQFLLNYCADLEVDIILTIYKNNEAHWTIVDLETHQVRGTYTYKMNSDDNFAYLQSSRLLQFSSRVQDIVGITGELKFFELDLLTLRATLLRPKLLILEFASPLPTIVGLSPYELGLKSSSANTLYIIESKGFNIINTVQVDEYLPNCTIIMPQKGSEKCSLVSLSSQDGKLLGISEDIKTLYRLSEDKQISTSTLGRSDKKVLGRYNGSYCFFDAQTSPPMVCFQKNDNSLDILELPESFQLNWEKWLESAKTIKCNEQLRLISIDRSRVAVLIGSEHRKLSIYEFCNAIPTKCFELNDIEFDISEMTWKNGCLMLSGLQQVLILAPILCLSYSVVSSYACPLHRKITESKLLYFDTQGNGKYILRLDDDNIYQVFEFKSEQTQVLLPLHPKNLLFFFLIGHFDLVLKLLTQCPNNSLEWLFEGHSRLHDQLLHHGKQDIKLQSLLQEKLQETKKNSILESMLKCLIDLNSKREYIDVSSLKYLFCANLIEQYKLASSKDEKIMPIDALKDFQLLTAFHSRSQLFLIDHLLSKATPENPVLWKKVKEERMCLWIKDKSSLVETFEILARNHFLDSGRDPTACSVFYLALRRKPALLGLWKICKSHAEYSNTYTFLNHDFTLKKWRDAAKKNAYALIGRRRFEYAVSFFLLAESPDEAIQCCIRQLNDFDLAFAISRLFCGDDSIQTKGLIESIVNNNCSSESYYLKSWAYWKLARFEESIQSFLIKRSSLSSPLDILVYDSLREINSRALQGSLLLNSSAETSFINSSIQAFQRIGCSWVSLYLAANWCFHKYDTTKVENLNHRDALQVTAALTKPTAEVSQFNISSFGF